MDRNGKKPKATHDEPPHPERSDTKAHLRDETEAPTPRPGSPRRRRRRPSGWRC
jgi:hypothetical protein